MITASIVLYRTPAPEVRKIVALLRACALVDDIWLIDNSDIQTEAFMFLPATYIFNQKNLGYGAGHNIALRKAIAQGSKYHLVINSDIDFKPEVIEQLVGYMETNGTVGQIMPAVKYPDGQPQHLAKLLPAPCDLISRRFLPASLTRRRTERFELHSLPTDRPSSVPYLSGCFMLLRCSALQTVGLFDEHFFMYPEDIDLTRRIHRKFSTVYYPLVSITHNHTRASYHSLRMLRIHITNMCRYFNKWGWFIDNERLTFNRETLKQIKQI